jgi:cytochrome o ubiquinol oxidase subunit 2
MKFRDEQMKRSLHFVFIGLSSLFAPVFSGGCGNLILLDPKGPVGESERFVIVVSFALMLIVVIPVVFMALWFPWKYRAANTGAVYSPKWSRSAKIEWVIWLIPAAIVSALGILVWNTTYHLDPFKPIDSSLKPVRIEAVSLDWKWLFIYPDQNIAVVNELVFPVHVPLSFRITSGTVMTSFFIPQLGSQIYAMSGMQTRLHLMADAPGSYAGQNQQFSGSGFADMDFKAIAMSWEEYEAWIQKVGQSPDKLDSVRFEELEKPGVRCPVAYFSSVNPGLFDDILRKFNKAMPMSPGAINRDSGAIPQNTGASKES